MFLKLFIDLYFLIRFMHFVQSFMFCFSPLTTTVFFCRFGLKSLGVAVTAFLQRFPATPRLCFWLLPTLLCFPHMSQIMLIYIRKHAGQNRIETGLSWINCPVLSCTNPVPSCVLVSNNLVNYTN